MRHTRSLFLAAISLLACASAGAATRPRYGGTLRIETGARLASLDPAKLPSDAGGLALAGKLFFLVGDRLVGIDQRGRVRPSLATHWQAARGDRDWTFDLREGVKFQDGAPLVARDVVAALAAVHPDWRLHAEGMQVRIDLPRPTPDLPLDLALAVNSILRVGQNGLLVGTGPFRVTEFTANHITLAANAEDWQGRPFLDGVEILTGRALREQWIDLELGRADVIEMSPDQVHRATDSHVQLWSSQPEEVVALVFAPGRSAAENASVRQALAAGVNRAALRDVLLQKQGEVAQSILPEWLTGYAFLFAPPAAPPPAPAAGALPPLSLAYDASDPILTSFAGRIALDARTVGIQLKLVPPAAGAPPADVRLVRERIQSLDPAEALRQIVSALGLTNQVTLPASGQPEQLFAAEQSLVQSHWVIPLVDLPEIYGLSSRVEDWTPPTVSLAGGWGLENVWKEPK
jgi:peptide/nickel transport system substrate-binding protein